MSGTTHPSELEPLDCDCPLSGGCACGCYRRCACGSWCGPWEDHCSWACEAQEHPDRLEAMTAAYEATALDRPDSEDGQGDR